MKKRKLNNKLIIGAVCVVLILGLFLFMESTNNITGNLSFGARARMAQPTVKEKITPEKKADEALNSLGCMCKKDKVVCPVDENTRARCSDKIDNDFDGKIDCQDPDCGEIAVASDINGNRIMCHTGFEYCYDQFDNDGNGLVDCADPNCREVCVDKDKDNDGYDAGQDDCDDNNPNINGGAREICNGIDDNCDGIIDGIGLGLCPPINRGDEPKECVMGTCVVSCNAGECENSEETCWQGYCVPKRLLD